MVDTFKPYKPEEKIKAEISVREANLLVELRRYAYGKFIVHKAENLIVRLECNESVKIEESLDNVKDLII